MPNKARQPLFWVCGSQKRPQTCEVSVGVFKYEQNEIPHTLSGLSN